MGKRRNDDDHEGYVIHDDAVTFDGDPICSYIKVIALSSDGKGLAKWGKLIEFKNPDGKINEVDISLGHIQSRPKDVLHHLADIGVVIHQPNKVLRFITRSTAERRVITIDRLGWIDSSTFLTPGGCIGTNSEGKEYVYRPPGQFVQGIEAVGTVAEWNRDVLPLVNKHMIFQFCLGAALAAPILNQINEYGFGVHLYGRSSTGKTTAARFVASIYGNIDHYVRQWKTTQVGLEDLARMFNDLPVVMDEILQAGSLDVGDAIYTLANGAGKQRGTPTGIIRDVDHWKVICISNGEVSMQQVVSQEKNGYTAGQEVRMIEIQTNLENGVFDKTDNPKKLADDIKSAITKNYGTVGRAWIEHLASKNAALKQGWEKWEELVSKSDDENYKLVFEQNNTSGQSYRVLRNIEVCCFALAVAIKAGIIDNELMPELVPKNLGKQIFAIWANSRGGLEEREKIEFIKNVQSSLTENMSAFIRGDKMPNGRIMGRVVEYSADATEYYLEETEFKAGTFWIPLSTFDKEFAPKTARRSAVKWLREAGMLEAEGRAYRVGDTVQKCIGIRVEDGSE